MYLVGKLEVQAYVEAAMCGCMWPQLGKSLNLFNVKKKKKNYKTIYSTSTSTRSNVDSAKSAVMHGHEDIFSSEDFPI